MKLKRIPSGWSADDNLVIEGYVKGTLTEGDLFDLLPHHSFHGIRRKVMWYGFGPEPPEDADLDISFEDIRMKRSCTVAAAALQRRVAEVHGRKFP